MTSVEQSGPTAAGLPRPSGRAPIDPATRIGVVALTVANLERAASFYVHAIGLRELSRSAGEAVLGVPGDGVPGDGATPLLVLAERPGALPWMTDGMTGLYHLAILVPDRASLGRWLRHYLTTPYPPPGQGDHVVSEALYLRDPDGHGIEIYADRPREGWVWQNGRVRMGGGPVDVRGLLAEAERSGQAWSGMPAGTTIGHVHLQVGDLAEAERFYHGVLGFDVVAGMDTALFVSAGGYHHHLGLNTWHSQGAGPAPEGTATLRFYSIALPNDQAMADVVARLDAAGVAHEPVGPAMADVVTRLDAAGVAHEPVGRAVAFADPWRNRVVLHAGTLPNAAAAAALGA